MKDRYILQTDQAKAAWSSADKLLQAVWRDTEYTESISRGFRPFSFDKCQIGKCQSQNGSSVKEGIAEFEVQDVVPVEISRISKKPQREPERELCGLPLEPAGF